jgi:hypothetical protein
MADLKISGLPASTTPLAGTEVLPIVQGATTKQVSVANLTAGRAVSALSLTSTNDATINTLTVGFGTGDSTSTVLGVAALSSNLSGVRNTAIGQSALKLNSTGSANTAVGRALEANTTGSNNTAMGRLSCLGNVSGSNNTGIGVQALNANSTSGNNTAIGFQAGFSTTGAANQFFGYGAGSGVTSGESNAILGAYAGAAAPISATGSNFVVLSDGAGNVRQYFNGSIAIFNGTISPVQATTAAAPAYVKGAMYFDTTLNKLRIGGATGWETVTSV